MAHYEIKRSEKGYYFDVPADKEADVFHYLRAYTEIGGLGETPLDDGSKRLFISGDTPDEVVDNIRQELQRWRERNDSDSDKDDEQQPS